MNAAEVSILVDSALEAQGAEGPDPTARNESLEELLDHPLAEVFEMASRLCESSKFSEKKLGVRILRELGRPEMPYAKEAALALSQVFEREQSPDLLVWAVSALGNQHVVESLPVLWELANHPDPGVRDSVLHGCLEHHTTYDETIAWGHRSDQKLPEAA